MLLILIIATVKGYGFDVTRPIKTQLNNFKRFGTIWKDELPGPIKLMVCVVKPEDAEKYQPILIELNYWHIVELHFYYCRLFRSEGKFPERPGFDAVKVYRQKRVEYYTSNGILPGKGDDWWRIRSKAQQPFLKTKNIHHYLPVLADIADEFIDK